MVKKMQIPKIKPGVMPYIKISAVIFAAFCVIWAFDGQWFFKAQIYNSYILQAQSWLKGRLDLGKDYTYLELAIKNGKYYVSFPPFPSYLMLPFVAFGLNNCDGFIALVSALMGGIYAFKVMNHFCDDEKRCMFFAFFVTLGSNWLFCATNAWVWFIAQNLTFTLSLMAIYYALEGKCGASLFCWACSIGCRPFQVIYIFVLLYLIYRSSKSNNKSYGIKDNIIYIIKKHRLAWIPCFAVALSYMWLNYARFGNITEFGHNYLPEFTRISTGQFNISYLKNNLFDLIRLPGIGDKGKISFPDADGVCLFIANPIFIAYIFYFIKSLVDKDEKNKIPLIILFALFLLHLFAIALHKTMGGAHYGNRYTNDLLPFVLLFLAYFTGKREKTGFFNVILCIAGFALNLAWVINFFNK